MCGIGGVFRFDGPANEEDARGVEVLGLAQRHRGPDDAGTARLGPCVLTSQRLSILDPTARGHMPMVSQDGECTVVHNGEIYNYVELRSELQALGFAFQSDGDTEVVLHAYRAWGPACVERFIGMWAFALWDKRRHTLVLSRDRLGIKPLYVHRSAQRLTFASEIKGIVAALRLWHEPVTANTASIATYVATGLVDGLPDTFFVGVRRFQPATIVQVTAAGESTARYWSLPDRVAALREHAPPADLTATLGSAVAVHLRSDVPLGVCLSGGLDSSAVVGLASQAAERLRTFTVFFDDSSDYDERAHARTVVAQFNCDAYEQSVDHGELPDTLQTMLWHLDEPTLAPGIVPQWQVMKLACEHVKVVLDGQGGDEVFGGYMNYLPHHLLGVLSDSPARLPAEVLGMARLHGWHTARVASQSAVAMRIRPATAPSLAGMADARILAADMRSLVDLAYAEWRLWPRVFSDWLNNILYWELTTTRLPALLRYEDRLSMAFSIESRVPLLDHRVVELAFCVPGRDKLHDGWTKYPLRRALRGLLPDSIIWRRDKKGFPTPLAAWLRDDRGAGLRALLTDPARRTRDIFPAAAVDGLLQAHLAGADRSALLWRLVSTELWLRAFQLVP